MGVRSFKIRPLKREPRKNKNVIIDSTVSFVWGDGAADLRVPIVSQLRPLCSKRTYLTCHMILEHDPHHNSFMYL